MAMYLLFFGLYAAIITWKLFYEGFQPGFQRRRQTPLSPCCHSKQPFTLSRNNQ